MYNEEKRYVRRYLSYGIMVLEEEQGGHKVWEIYYMLKGFPWTYAFGLLSDCLSVVEMFNIAEDSFDYFADELFKGEED